MKICEIYDVIVAGAGTSGIPSAIQSAHMGAKTLLIEKNGMPGGTITSAGVSYPGIFSAYGKQIIAGIGWELIRRTLEETGTPLPDLTLMKEHHWEQQIAINGSIFGMLAEEELLKSGVELLYHAMPAALVRENGYWKMEVCTKTGLKTVFAKVIIDCTGDANTTVIAGFKVKYPTPCQPGSFTVYLDGYDVSQLNMESIEKAFEAALVRGEVCSDDCGWTPGHFSPHFLYQHGINPNHISGINAFDSEGRTAIECAGHASILRMYRFLKKQPGFEKLELKFSTSECGVRETAVIEGESTVCLADYLSGKRYPDSICYAYYPVDIHDEVLGLDVRKLPPGIVPVIPRSAMIPKGSEHFIVAGRCISSDHESNSSLRVQAPCMAMGQAAGAMAALSAETGLTPMALPMEKLSAVLRDNGAIVPECS